MDPVPCLLLPVLKTILFLQSFLIKSLSLTVRVFKDAVVVSDVSAHELDILRYIGLRGTHFGRPELPGTLVNIQAFFRYTDNIIAARFQNLVCI